MWTAISSLITIALPVLIKLIYYIIEKKNYSDDLKADMVKFIESLSNEATSIKLRNSHLAQIERIKAKIKKRDEELKNITEF